MLEYFWAFVSILWPFGRFYSYLVYFPRFGMLSAQKNQATLSQMIREKLHIVVMDNRAQINLKARHRVDRDTHTNERKKESN
jgi:hypothetical protein